MPQRLNNTAMSVCVTLLKSIEAIEELKGEDGSLNEIQFCLVEAYHDLTDVLSLVYGVDAQKISRDTITSEIESLRALLVARMGAQ